MSNENSEIHVFYSYSHKDEHFREQLEEHLAIFKRIGLIQGWSDRKILSGQDWKSAIDSNIERADLILLLVSSSFIASDYCYEKELALAISRHESGMARVVPIFIRPAEWKEAPFAGIQGLPKDALPVTQWENEDVAWQNIAAGLRAVLGAIRDQKGRSFAHSEMKTLQEALTEAVEQIDHLYSADDITGINGIPTGIVDFDRVTTGLHKGDLFVIASRPSMGKTNFSLNIAAAVAEDAGLPVLIFSTKMAAREISQRLAATRARINHNNINTGRLCDEDWPKLVHAIQALNDYSLLIDDSSTINIADLKDRCMREKKKFGKLGLVVIDSIQYLRADSNSRQPKELGQFLKSLARELDTTILVTSQVSREVELRPNKRPVLRDIDKFPDLVDEADVVTFIYIDSHYNFESTDSRAAELIIAKNQFGPVGTIRVSHTVEHGAFRDFSVS